MSVDRRGFMAALVGGFVTSFVGLIHKKHFWTMQRVEYFVRFTRPSRCHPPDMRVWDIVGDRDMSGQISAAYAQAFFEAKEGDVLDVRLWLRNERGELYIDQKTQTLASKRVRFQIMEIKRAATETWASPRDGSMRQLEFSAKKLSEFFDKATWPKV